MRFPMIACRWITVFAMLYAGAALGQPIGADAKRLEGAWVPTFAELGGDAFPDAVLKTMKLAIAGDKYKVTVGDSVDRGTLKIDPAAKPKTMDIVSTEGANKGKTFLAIYEFKDDTLRICYDLTGKQRPKAFATKKGELTFLVTYQRAKP